MESSLIVVTLIVECLLGFYLLALIALMVGCARFHRRVRQRRIPADEMHLPTVSVVVAARNEAGNLPRLLACLLHQEYPKDKLEIVVVDDRSDDGTEGLLSKMMAGHDNLKSIRISDERLDFAPKKRALDLGIRSSTGEIVLLTDADCSPPPTWVRAMVGFYDEGVMVVLGYSPYRFDVPTLRLLRGMLALDYFSLAAIAAASIGLGRPLTATGTNLSYRKEAFLLANGFERIKQWISGDADHFVHLAARENLGKFSFALNREAFVPAAAPTSWKQFWHQRIRYASKGTHYEPMMVIGLASVYLLNVFIVLAACLTLAGFDDVAWPGLSAWGVKSLFEYAFLRQAAIVFGERSLLRYFLPTALLHPLYVTAFGFLGLLGSFRWKGSRFRKLVSQQSRHDRLDGDSLSNRLRRDESVSE